MDGKRKFYVVETYQRKGPFNIEELKKYGITKDSLIWAFEFDEPKKASEIDELAPVFENVQNEVSENINPDKEEKKLSDEELLAKYNEIKEQEKNEKPPDIEEIETDKKDDLNDEKDTDTENEVDNVSDFIENNENEKLSNDENPENEEFIDSVEEQDDKEDTGKERKDKYSASFHEQLQEDFIEKEEHFTDDENQEKRQTYQNIEYSSTSGEKPQNYIVWSIILTIMCCSPLAFAAIFTGAQVDKKMAENDFEAAERMSKTTRILLIISLILGIISWIWLLTVAD